MSSNNILFQSKSIQKENFFCVETIRFCNSLSSMLSNQNQKILLLSKLKPKDFCKFYKILILLSGDIHQNPGLTYNPCAVCEKGVRRGVYCTICNQRIHIKCGNVSHDLAEASLLELTYVCSICQKHNSDADTWHLLPFYMENIDEAVDDAINSDTSVAEDIDKWLPFKKRGLHFIHLNINSLLSKIDELREIAKASRAAVIGISESKLDETVLDGEVAIEGFDLVRSDRNRHDGGVACYIR